MRAQRSTLFTLVAVVGLTACEDATAPTRDLGAGEASLQRGRSSTIECRNQVLTGALQSVYVPPGQSCWLWQAHVSGDVIGDQPRSVEVARSRVDGDIRITGGGGPGDFVRIINQAIVTGGHVHVSKRTGGSISMWQAYVQKGNVQIDQNLMTDWLWVEESEFSHHLQLRDNEIPPNSFAVIQRNRVGQHLKFFDHGGAGSKWLINNQVSHNLQCFRNDAPFTAAGNQARHTQGQCGAAGTR